MKYLANKKFLLIRLDKAQYIYSNIKIKKIKILFIKKKVQCISKFGELIVVPIKVKTNFFFSYPFEKLIYCYKGFYAFGYRSK